mmetsp:Transcript_97592/g.252561  ORF Transcript_97592/g.252561 Transcript_97592/m.252561 type:complete len:425 (+) Transcript_97592:1288-2562(+)
MHKVAEGDARLHLALEANEDGLRHVQRHHAGGGGESNGAGAGREGDAHREPGVRVTASADGVGEQHAVEPGVDDAVTRAEGDTATVADEVRQGVVRDDVNGLRVGRGVAEGLHHEVRGEAEAGEVLQLIACHRAGGVLAAHRGHLRLQVHARQHTGQAARLGHHLLRERVASGRGRVRRSLAEDFRRREPEGLAGPGGDLLANDQGHTAASLDTVQDGRALELELREHGVRAMRLDLALVGVDVDDVAHVQAADIGLDGERAGVLHGVEEDGGDGAANANAAKLLVGHVRVLVTHQPEHRVRRGLARGAGADDITHVRQLEAFLLEVDDLRLTVVDAIAGVLEHGKRVQRNVRTGPRILRRGKVIGVRLARHLEDAERDLLRDRGPAGEPLSLRPALDHLIGVLVARLHLLLDIEFGVEHQDRL